MKSITGLAGGTYQEGYRKVVDCDLKSYFDMIHHQRLRTYLEEFISDKIVLKFSIQNSKTKWIIYEAVQKVFYIYFLNSLF